MKLTWPDLSDKPIFSFVIMLLMLAASTAVLSGCTSSNPVSENSSAPNMAPDEQSAPQGGFGNRTARGGPQGEFGNRSGMNLTDAQREQFTQQGITACQGKIEGDDCTLQSPRGNMAGTCRAINGTLSCTPQAGRAGGPRGNWGPEGNSQ